EVPGQPGQHRAALPAQLVAELLLVGGGLAQGQQGQQALVEPLEVVDQRGVRAGGAAGGVEESPGEVGLGVLPGQRGLGQGGVGQDQPLAGGEEVRPVEGAVEAGGGAGQPSGVVAQQGGLPGADRLPGLALGVQVVGQVVVTVGGVGVVLAQHLPAQVEGAL